MTQQDLEAFGQVLTWLVGHYPHAQVDIELVFGSYFKVLAPLSLAEVQQVCADALQEYGFFPTVHDMVTLVAQFRKEKRHQQRLEETARANAQLREAPWTQVSREEFDQLMAQVTQALSRWPGPAPAPAPGGEVDAVDTLTLPRRQFLAEQAALLRASGLWRPAAANGQSPAQEDLSAAERGKRCG